MDRSVSRAIHMTHQTRFAELGKALEKIARDPAKFEEFREQLLQGELSQEYPDPMPVHSHEEDNDFETRRRANYEALVHERIKKERADRLKEMREMRAAFERNPGSPSSPLTAHFNDIANVDSRRLQRDLELAEERNRAQDLVRKENADYQRRQNELFDKRRHRAQNDRRDALLLTNFSEGARKELEAEENDVRQRRRGDFRDLDRLAKASEQRREAPTLILDFQ